MPEYVIHIGPPKTGTTYLQRLFTRMAPSLRQRGILYPLDLGAPGHVDLAKGLADPNARSQLAPVFAALNATSARTILLSTEDLSPLRPGGIEALRDLIGPNPVRIVFYCRRWSEMVRSRWGERIKHGSLATLQSECVAALETPMKTAALNYGLVLHRWAAVFGRTALRLVALNTLTETRTEIATHFLRQFLNVDETIPPPLTLANSSMSLGDTEVLRALNEAEWLARQCRSSAIRKTFLRRRDQLDLTLTEAAIATHPATILFDETGPRLARLHRALFAEFGDLLVEPHLDDHFFVPRRATIDAVDPGYLHMPGVRAELAVAHAALTAPPGSGLRARGHERPAPGHDRGAAGGNGLA